MFVLLRCRMLSVFTNHHPLDPGNGIIPIPTPPKTHSLQVSVAWKPGFNDLGLVWGSRSC